MRTIKSRIRGIPWLLKLYRGFYWTIVNPVKYQCPTYLAALKRSPRHVETKFILFCSPRSGSTLIGALAGQAPDVHWDGESFYQGSRWPYLYIEGKSKRSKKKCYGMKIFSEEIVLNGRCLPEDLLLKLCRSGWKIIWLQRQDQLSQAISRLKAIRQNKWSETVSDSQSVSNSSKIRINPTDLVKLMTKLDQHASLQSSCMKSIPHLSIIYEQHLKDQSLHQDTANLIFNYLGIPPVVVDTNMKKQSTNRLVDGIENPGEIIAALKDTQFEKYIKNMTN